MCIFVSLWQGWTLPPVFLSQPQDPTALSVFFPFNSFASGRRKKRNEANYAGLDTYKTWQCPWEPVYIQTSIWRNINIYGCSLPPLSTLHTHRFISAAAGWVQWATARAWAWRKLLFPMCISTCCLRARFHLESYLNAGFFGLSEHPSEDQLPEVLSSNIKNDVAAFPLSRSSHTECPANLKGAAGAEHALDFRILSLKASSRC